MITTEHPTYQSAEYRAIMDLATRTERAVLELADTYSVPRARRLAKLIDRYGKRAEVIVEPLTIPHAAFPLSWVVTREARPAVRTVRSIARSAGVNIHEFLDDWIYPLS